MAKYTDPLSRVRIAAPCHADWDSMTGTERARFCSSCNLHVYNLSAMTRTEAECLVVESEGRLCVHFYRRSDGTILTQNCPVGVQRLKQRAQRMATATISAVLGFMTGFGSHSGYSFGTELKRLLTQPEPQLVESMEDAEQVVELGAKEAEAPEPMAGMIEMTPATDIDNGIYVRGYMTLEPISREPSR